MIRILFLALILVTCAVTTLRAQDDMGPVIVSLTGKVTKVAAASITVMGDGADAATQVSVDESTAITSDGNDIILTAIKVGAKVEVTYEAKDAPVAMTITVLPDAEMEPPVEAPME